MDAADAVEAADEGDETGDAVDPVLPTPARVARRALALAAVAGRALLEHEDVQAALHTVGPPPDTSSPNWIAASNVRSASLSVRKSTAASSSSIAARKR